MLHSFTCFNVLEPVEIPQILVQPRHIPTVPLRNPTGKADGLPNAMACAGSPAQAVPAMWAVLRHSPTTGNITLRRPRQG